MPVCCWCNGSGRCMSCSCVKTGRQCTDCLPSRNAPSPTPVSASTSDNERLQLVDSTPAAAPTTNNEHHLLAMSDGTISTVSNELPNSQDMVANDSQLSDTVTAGPNKVQTQRPPSLLPFRPAPSMTSYWGGVPGGDFSKMIDDAYAQVVYRRLQNSIWSMWQTIISAYSSLQ